MSRFFNGLLEHQNPLVTGPVRGGTDYPATEYSLLRLSDPEVLLWALKPAEEGIARGMIAQVWNLASQPRRLTLRCAMPIRSAKRVTHIETDLAEAQVVEGAISELVPAHGLRTFRLFP